MGVLKKYSPAIACDALRLYAQNNETTTGKRPVPEWYDVSGTKYINLLGTLNPSNYGHNMEYCANLTGFDQNMVPFATSDLLDDYSVFDYGVSPIGITNYSKSISRNEYGTDLVFTLRISNSNSEDSYILNSDPIWRDYREYYIREGSQEPYTYTRVAEKPSDFITTYNTYYVLVSAGPIVVKCIKFRKVIYINTNGGEIASKTTSYCAYFLDEDEWITIPPGESRNLVIDFAAVIS